MIRLNAEGNGFYQLKDTTTKSFLGGCEVWNRIDFYEIWNVRIFEEFQRNGYATTMLKRVIKKHKDKPIRLYVFKSNTIAIHLYEKLGFKIIGEYKGRRDPAWTMEYKK